jgi:hypothetical protein
MIKEITKIAGIITALAAINGFYSHYELRPTIHKVQAPLEREIKFCHWIIQQSISEKQVDKLQKQFDQLWPEKGGVK